MGGSPICLLQHPHSLGTMRGVGGENEVIPRPLLMDSSDHGGCRIQGHQWADGASMPYRKEGEAQGEGGKVPAPLPGRHQRGSWEGPINQWQMMKNADREKLKRLRIAGNGF